MRFNYDSEITQTFKNRAVFFLVSLIIILIGGGITFSDWISNLSYSEVNDINSNPVIIILLMAVVCIIGTLGLKSILTYIMISECLKTNYIEITCDRLNGVMCEDLKSKDNVSFFSLSPDEILKVEKAQSDSYYTIYIHTKNQTYRLCIENSDTAISQIIKFASKEIANKIYQCPKCSQKVYLGQEKCNCGQTFDWTKLNS